jgi:hypothetical protein
MNSARRSLDSVLSYLASLSLLGLVVGGCALKSNNASGDGAPDATEQADSADANASSTQASSFSEIFSQGVQATEPASAASQVQMTAAVWPAGCATRTVDPTNANVVHIHYNQCTGPFGLVALTGDMTATFSANASGGLHVVVSSSDLTANGKPVSHAASGDITVNGAERDVTWQGAWTRVNAKGETVAHTTSYTIVVDTTTHCRDTNGTAVTTVGDREVDSTIKDYKMCRNAQGVEECPSGTIVHTHKRTGRALTVSFDGSTEATLTGPRGGSIELPLVCPAAGS